MTTLRGVIFDLDGTLVDSGLDFGVICREIGIPRTPLLETIADWPEDRRQQAMDILNRHEIDGAEEATVFPGVIEFLDYLKARDVRIGVLTRNCRACAERMLGRLDLPFEVLLTREDEPVKPAPDGVHAICRQWSLEPEEVILIGDYLFDLQAGRSAGCRTALVTHGRDRDFAELADYRFEHFGQAVDVLGDCFNHDEQDGTSRP